MPAGLVGETCGPYRILRELGSGGMGTVYLAETDDVPRRVALKLLHPHLLRRKGFFTRFRREAESGRRVDHPHVVRTLDCDLILVGDELCYFLVMEYVEGQTLRDLLREIGPVPDGLLREIALQTAAGLAAIHAEGIVHRDLKPENVLLAQDQRVRIMDLGIAKSEETTAAISVAGKFAGSLLYAAPEQIRQEQTGPATDLYALGVLLHELASGQNPFRRENAAATMYAHLHHDPPALDKITPFLAAIVEELLQKSPLDRFGSAAALHRTLQEGEESHWWRERREDSGRRPASGVRIPVRRATKIYGRDEERQQLRAIWDRAKEGAGGAVLVEGEAGIGKTRLIDAFVRSVAGEGATVLYGSYAPSPEEDALEHAVLERFGEDDLEQELSWHLENVPDLAPGFVARLLHRPLPEGAVPLDGGALKSAWCELMRGLARERPLLWIVEDLQFAPPERRAVVAAMARAVAGHRALLLASVRTPHDGGAAALAGANVAHVPLRRLTASEVMRLLNDAFRNRELSERLGGRIAEKSDGVPFFVCEMIRGLSERRFLSELPDGRFVERRTIDRIEVPDAVRDLIEARLADLTPSERTLLDVASVQGFEFDPMLTARVLGLEKVTALQQVARLERRLGVVRGEDRLCRFDHHQVQEVVYTGLMPTLRAEYHTLVARALAEQADADGAAQVHPIAFHHLRGNTPDAAFPVLHDALAHLHREVRNDAVVELADLALHERAGLVGEPRVRVLLFKASALGVLGRSVEQARELERARELCLALGDRALLLHALVELGGVGARGGGRDRLESTLALARELADAHAEARALVALGDWCTQRGELEDARGHHEHAVEIARAADDTHVEALAASHLAECFLQLGRYPQARDSAEEARRVMHEVRDRTGEIKATLHLAAALGHTGDLYRAREKAEQAGVIAASMGFRRGETAAALDLGSTLRALGRWPEAGERYERCVKLARELGDGALEARALGGLSAYLFETGQPSRALECAEASLRLREASGDRIGVHRMHARCGYIRAVLGGPEEARREVEDACRALGALRVRGFEADARHALGRIAELRGDKKEARRRYDAVLLIRRANGQQVMALRVLVARGRLDPGGPHLVEAVRLADELGLAHWHALARIHRLAVEPAASDEVRELFAAQELRLPVLERIEAHAALRRVSGVRAYLDEAVRLLMELRELVPEPHRDALFEQIPLFGEILGARR